MYTKKAKMPIKGINSVFRPNVVFGGLGGHSINLHQSNAKE